MNKNDIIIYEVNSLDITDLTSEQIDTLASNIINTVNIKQLEEKVHEVILKLSRVGDPTLDADIEYIAMDNQQRLNLIYMLMYNMDLFKYDVKNLKHNRLGCREDSDKIYSFIYRTKELIQSIMNYGQFSYKEYQEQQKYLQELNNKYMLLNDKN